MEKKIKEFVTKELEKAKVRLDVAQDRLREKEEKGESFGHSYETISWNEGKIKAFEIVLKELESGL